LTVVGLPLAFWIFNRIGTLLTLRPRTRTTTIVGGNGTTTVSSQGAKQRPLWLRAIWFVLVGWWAALIWMIAAYLISLTIIGIPVGIMMLNRLPGGLHAPAKLTVAPTLPSRRGKPGGELAGEGYQRAS
jgi:uncharacterized membrane protein YccF (DUF307 family)